MTATTRDWGDVAEAATGLAGNWQRFDCFAWFRGHDLPDAANWLVWYTSSPQSGLLDESNQKAVADRLAKFGVGDDPDIVFEKHSHWVVGHVDGISLRVFQAGGTVTDAFYEFCRTQEALDAYPVLDEEDYSDREYAATLVNYRNEMWKQKDELPEGWAGEVHSWFEEHGQDCHTVSRDDRGGYAPQEAITEALTDLGMLPRIVVGK